MPSRSAGPIEILLRQEGESDPEIRSLSLNTLIDSPALSIAALLWTQLCWLFVFIVSGWTWISAFVAAYCSLWAIRWPLVQNSARTSNRRGTHSDVRLVSMNIGLIFLVACEIFVLTQVPVEQGSILALCLCLGFSAYVVAFFPAFPILATLKIALLNIAMTVGVIMGPSDLVRPVALLLPGGALIYWLMIQRTHLILMGAIRNQQANRHLALHDPLTKLPNRTAMREALDRHLSRMGRDGTVTSLAILCLDLDGFKQVNDRYGHSAGDWVLVHVSEILRRPLLRDEIVCRIGGDEYVVLLPNADEARVRAFSQFVIDAVAQPFDIGRSVPAQIGISIGAFIARDGSRRAEEMIEAADLALYTSKKNGRGQLNLSSDLLHKPNAMPPARTAVD